MQEKEHTLSKKCRLRDAFRYIRKHWVALCNFCDDGLAEADNNTAERALRAVCLGKKNYVFFGSDHGGERGALLYGLIGTCRLNGIDPEAYLRHILSVLPEWLSNRVDELLPWNVVLTNMNRPGFHGECFICELRLPDHRFRWKHNKLFCFCRRSMAQPFQQSSIVIPVHPRECGPAPLLSGFSSSYGVLPPLCKGH